MSWAYEVWITLSGELTLNDKDALEDLICGTGAIIDRSPRSIYVRLEADDLWDLASLVHDLSDSVDSSGYLDLGAIEINRNLAFEIKKGERIIKNE